MCERSGKRGCCIVYVEKLSFMHEKRASPRLNIRHVNLAVSGTNILSALFVRHWDIFLLLFLNLIIRLLRTFLLCN